MERESSALPLDHASTRELIVDLAHSLSALAARHAELAKAEASVQIRKEMRMAGWLGAAAALLYAGVGLLLATAVLALGTVMAAWAAALIVAVAVLLLAALAAGIGYRNRVRRALERTRATLGEDIRWLRPRTA